MSRPTNAAVSTVAALAIGVPVARVAQDDPVAKCAAKYPTHKADLEGVHWTWVLPGWSCEFRNTADGHVP
jgi:hypothetical protein